MKKIISLVFIVILMFFSNIKTVALKDNVDLLKYEILQNDDMVQTKFDNYVIVFKERVVPIIEDKISINFDYTYNKFIIKKNNMICAITPYDIINTLSNEESTVLNKYLLSSSKPRSDKKNSMVNYTTIRGPCDIINQRSIYLIHETKNYEEKT